MRASLLLCATLLLICAEPVLADGQWQADWQSYRDNSQGNSVLEWSAAPLDGWRLTLSSELQDTRDASYDRRRLQAELRWSLLHQWQGLSGGPVCDWHRATDEGLSGGSDYTYGSLERAAGVQLNMQPLSSMSISGEWLWAFREEKSDDSDSNLKVNSDGLRGQTALTWSADVGINHLETTSEVRLSEVEQDRSRSMRQTLTWLLPLPAHSLSTNLRFNRQSTDLYSLFQRTDTQRKTNWQAETSYRTTALPLVDVELKALLDRTDNHYDADDYRDYSQNVNRLDMSLNLPLNAWSLFLNGSRESNDRTYDSGDGDLLQEYRLAEYGAAWSFTPRDTLRVIRMLRLRRSDMPNASLCVDNDLAEAAWTYEALWFVRDRVHLNALYRYQNTRRVYINSQMSGDNNTRRSHLLQPVLCIAPGRGWMLEQSYALLAEYIDYRWNTSLEDRFYRQMIASFRVGWDQTPQLAGMDGPVWSTLPWAPGPDAPWTVWARYRYIASEAGDLMDDDYYEISDERERHEATLQAGRMGARWNWRSQAVLTWEGSRDLSLETRVEYRAGQSSLLSLRIKPYGRLTHLSTGRTHLFDLPYPRLLKDVEWQIDASVQLAF